jgi:hypothetical protein
MVLGFFVFGSGVGIILAWLRWRVFLVIAASAVVALAVIMCGSVLGHPLGISVFVGCGSVAAVQASYVALGLALELFASENLIPTMQDAIARQLRSELRPPRDLPAPLANLVQRLGAA